MHPMSATSSRPTWGRRICGWRGRAAARFPRWPASPASESLDRLLREGRPEFREQQLWTPHRPPRPEKSEGGRRLVIKSDFEPKGDQPQAIAELVEGVQRHDRTQVLLGVTGSGKTFTMAKVIEATQRPALILAPNKTLAAQLYGEFRNFFPDNAVEYFVSYYDYYQPEAYIPRTDTYIEKDSSINEQIDRMRHSATRALLERDDVDHRRLGVVHLRYRLGRDLFGDDVLAQARRAHRPARAARRSGRAAIQAHRRRFLSRLVPRARRRHRDFSRALRGPRLAGVAVRRRGGIDPRIRSAHRPEDRRAGIRQNLRQFALRNAATDAAAGDRRHQDRAAAAARSAPRRRPAAGSAAARAAHALRSGNDGGDRRLRRHRELFALSHRAQAGRAAADFVRIRARQRAGVRRRKPRHRSAARRHVSRRLPPQGDARRIRLPPAVLHGQPAAAVRGMGRDAAADHLRVGDARAVGAQRIRRRVRRAGDPPDRPDRSAGRHPPGAHPGRRSGRRGPCRWRSRATAASSPC